MNRAVAEGILADLQYLHDSKQAAYGNSWCRHGEHMSIMANLSRKADRLEVLDTTGTALAGETRLDTLADLAVYAMLYYSWLSGWNSDPDEGLAAVCHHVLINLSHNLLYGLGVASAQNWRASYDALLANALDEARGVRHMSAANKAIHLTDIAVGALAALVLECEMDPDTYKRWSAPWQPRIADVAVPIRLQVADGQ